MKNHELLARTLWFLLLLLPLTGGCASNMKKFEWTEDVKLADGRVILVQRMTEFRSVMDVGAGFQRGALFDNASISADLPAPVSRRVEWAGRGLSPFILEMLPDGRVYLVCLVETGEGSHLWKVPRHEFYVSFLLEDDKWKRIPLPDLPPMMGAGNLMAVVHTVFIVRAGPAPKHLDFKAKDTIAAEHALNRIRREIVRLPDPQAK